jgi:hypothetical protein
VSGVTRHARGDREPGSRHRARAAVRATRVAARVWGECASFVAEQQA